MKKTGRMVYLSGVVGYDTADALLGSDPTRPVAYFQNILTDERKGYAYKVVFASTFPNIASSPSYRNIPYVIQTFSARELRKMTQAQLTVAAGNYQTRPQGIADNNRTVGIVGQYDANNDVVNLPYQTNYVIKGDAMVTEALSLSVECSNNTLTGSRTSYYIELEEYEVNDNEEILLLLNERAQNAGNPEGA